MLFSHRRHGPPFVDACVALDRVLGPTWLLRRVRIAGVVQDERVTHGVLGRAAGTARARATVVVEGCCLLFIGDRQLAVAEGDFVITPRGAEPLARVTDATMFELEWDPAGALGGDISDVHHAALGDDAREAIASLTARLAGAGRGAHDGLGDSAARVMEALCVVGAPIDVDAAMRDLEDLATTDEQELTDAIDDVLSSLADGPQVVSLEDRLGCSRRTVLRRTQALCKRYLLPGLAAEDWRGVRDTYRLLIGAIFATHPAITSRTLAAMLGYASTEALCHAFANAGLPSPAALREQVTGFES